MRSLSLIVCVDENGYIGSTDNKLVRSIPEDMKRFKELTKGCAVVMGMNTFKSMDSKPLKGRINVVVTRNAAEENDKLSAQYGKELFSGDAFRIDGKDTYLLFIDNLDYVMNRLYLYSEDVVIIGGAQIYKAALERFRFDSIYITSMHSWNPKDNWMKDDSHMVKFPFEALVKNIQDAQEEGLEAITTVYPSSHSLMGVSDVDYRFYRIEFLANMDDGVKPKANTLRNDKFMWTITTNFVL